MIRNFLVSILLYSPMAFVAGQTSFSVGGGLEYNMVVESPGANIRGYYNIGEHFCFGPEISVFLPKTTLREDETEELFEYEFNLNAHYVFELTGGLCVYPILGLNYTVEDKELSSGLSGERETYLDRAFGANVGVGAHYPLRHFSPFIEYHYTVSDLPASVITLGLFFTFGKEEENQPNERE